MATVSIWGGGINGVTTGLLLQLLGYDTTLRTARRPDQPGPDDPRVASLYPAASVIPHAVTIDDLVARMEVTQAFFDAVRSEAPSAGVRRHWHYEVFETPAPDPPYAPAMQDFARLDALSTDARPGDNAVPRRTDDVAVHGWRFRVLFAETPRYLPWLYAQYQEAGGQVQEQSLTRADVAGDSADVIVNCTGFGSQSLFDDPRPSRLLRGCLIYAPPPDDAPPPGRLASYNYTPTPSVYRNAEGNAEGVYFYPRGDAWVLGGSRRRVEPRPDTPPHNWPAEPLAGPTREVDGQTVPAPVFTLNRALLRRLTGHDIMDQPLRATFGYRFARDLDGQGVRLDTTREDGRPVVHNYGHGGAGVTLSWTCAVSVAAMLRDQAFSPSPPASTSLSAARSRLRNLGRRYVASASPTAA
jgi:D-amino-acid oxidase